MRLLFIGYLHGFGGAEKMLIMLANEMAIRGYDVDLLSLVSNNPKYIINPKINYYFIKDEGNSKIGKLKNRFMKLNLFIKKSSPDLIINFWFQSAYFCAFMGKEIARKTIYAERGDPYDKEYSGVLGIIRKVSFQKIGGFVFQSKGAQNCFGKKIQEKSCIIYNPVFLSLDGNDRPKEREKRIVTVGRLHKQKNHELLINAFANLPKDKNEYILEIYGEGELNEFLQEKIDSMGLKDRVFLKGTFENVHNKILNAALFVLSSDYEGLPNVLIEAMVLGLPCISTDCKPGGAREIITDKIDGIIVPCGAVKELSDAMNELLSDEKKAEEYSKKAILKKQYFNPSSIFDKWEKYLLDLVKG